MLGPLHFERWIRPKTETIASTIHTGQNSLFARIHIARLVYLAFWSVRVGFRVLILICFAPARNDWQYSLSLFGRAFRYVIPLKSIRQWSLWSTVSWTRPNMWWRRSVTQRLSLLVYCSAVCFGRRRWCDFEVQFITSRAQCWSAMNRLQSSLIVSTFGDGFVTALCLCVFEKKKKTSHCLAWTFWDGSVAYEFCRVRTSTVTGVVAFYNHVALSALQEYGCRRNAVANRLNSRACEHLQTIAIVMLLARERIKWEQRTVWIYLRAERECRKLEMLT